jgi:hypothetical protein
MRAMVRLRTCALAATIDLAATVLGCWTGDS